MPKKHGDPVNVNDLEKNFRRRARAHRMGGSESENVISIRPGSHDDDTKPLALRDVILFRIEFMATLFNGAPSQTPPDECLQNKISTLICALADAGMPFDTWKDEISDETLAGLRRLEIKLHPEIDAALLDATCDAAEAALENHPDWVKIGNFWTYRGDEETKLYDIIDWFERTYPDEAREIAQHFPGASTKVRPRTINIPVSELGIGENKFEITEFRIDGKKCRACCSIVVTEETTTPPDLPQRTA